MPSHMTVRPLSQLQKDMEHMFLEGDYAVKIM